MTDDHMYLHCQDCVHEAIEDGTAMGHLEVYVEQDGVTLVVRCMRHDGTLARLELKNPVGLPCSCAECGEVVGDHH